MKEHGALALCLAVAIVAVCVSHTVAAEVRAVGVLENNPSKYSSCVAISEDGTWVVGNSKKMDSNLVLCDWPFIWTKTGGMQDMTNPSGGNSYVTGCAVLWNGSPVACGNVGGVARKWVNGAWSILPGQSETVRSVFCISRDETNQETWIGGSSYPAENEKAYRYQWSNNSYIDFWGYYQDVYGISHKGWGAGKNNWGNGQSNPDWRYDHPILIFDWNYNCAAGGNCGWDQLKRFAGYGDTEFYKGRATAISPGTVWVVGYLTYTPADLSLYHAFKWLVPRNPQLVPEPGLVWDRPTDLGALPGDQQSFAYCVSDTSTNPVIGGKSYLASRGEKAVYWDNAGIHDLYAELQSRGVDLSRWSSLARVLGVSANGQVMCGFGYYDDDGSPATPAIQMGFVADFTPNPQPPVITQQPQPKAACQGGTVTFLVDAAGDGPITYQWQKNEADLSNGGHCSGVTTVLLTISNADSGDAGNYRCVATNPYGSANSNSAVLAVASAVPSTPTDGTATADATDKITWKWADVADEFGFRVKDGGGAVLSGDLLADITQWQEASLVANTPHTRRVYAFNGCGESAGSGGQSRYTLAIAPTYGTGTTTPTVFCDKGPNAGGFSPGANVTFTATNGFGDGPSRVSQFGYLWDQNAGTPASWTGEQFWTSGTLVQQVGASGNWYLHLRSYNNDAPKAANNTAVLTLGPYVVGAALISCLPNAGFEEGFTSGIGSSWAAFAYSGTVTYADETTGTHGGGHCQKLTVASSASEGGVYQRFDTTPGLSYTVKVWIRVSSGGNAAGYLGVDPYGGTDCHSGNVWWGGKTSTTWSQKAWTGIAQSTKITVFLDASSTNSSSATCWFDDAEPACSVPDAPFDGRPIALSTTGIRWMWSDVTGETGYRVKDTGGTNLSGDLAVNTTQWEETTGLSPNTQYTRKIYAFAAGGESAGSAGQSRYTLIPAPAGVAFGAVTAGSIDVSPSGTLPNLTTQGSGVRIANPTAGTDSGWVQSMDAWTSSGLAANTQYSFVARARNGEAVETADSPAATKWTLSVAPGAGSVTPSNTSPCPNDPVVWTAAGGFGAGMVEYYRWTWDQSPTHTWTGSETQWSSGTIPTWPTSAGTWYLHVQGYNGEGVANGAYDYAVTATVLADFDSDGDVDLADFSIFQGCFNGPNRVPAQSNCERSDLDHDTDVDLADFSVFQGCFNGPNRPPACD
jgi:hypothetical protein